MTQRRSKGDPTPVRQRRSRETDAVLNGILEALVAHGFELPHQPVAPSGEWASNLLNRDALVNALSQMTRDQEVGIRIYKEHPVHYAEQQVHRTRVVSFRRGRLYD